MARRPPPGVIIGVVVTVSMLGTLLLVYLTVLAPQLKERAKLRKELEDAEAQFKRVQNDFGHNRDPQAELRLLRAEIASLETAVASLVKVSEARLPDPLLPEELQTDDEEQLLRRYRDYLEEQADETEDRVREAYRDKRVTLDHSIEFPHEIKEAKDAFERRVTLLAAEDLSMLLLDADVFVVRELENVEAKRQDTLWRLGFDVETELSAESLTRLLYLMREQTAYYYLEDVEIKPATDRRGSSFFDANEELDLSLTATIRTLRTTAEELDAEDRRERARQQAEARAAAQEAQESNPWMQAIRAINDPTSDKSQFGEQKPWWKFW